MAEGGQQARLDVEAQTSAALVYSLRPPKRGQFSFGRVAVRYLSNWRLAWSQTTAGEPITVKVYPNMRRAREAELKALGTRSFVAARRKSQWRGEGRDFESLRDYVRGDEMRHISWTATARRGKLVTRQYQMERDQTILVALDAGRLMTGRLEHETKLDLAVHATLALMSAAARAGDNAGLLVFGRRIKTFLPPKRGAEHLDAALEALHAIEPEMIEPSYARAFEFVSANSQRRSLVVVLTDLVDEEGSAVKSQTKDTLRRSGIGAGTGAIIGAIIGGTKGAIIGAGIGAGAGAGTVAIQNKGDLELQTGSSITVQASSPIN